MPPAPVKLVASPDKARERSPEEEQGKRRVFWRLPKGGLEPFSFLRWPGELYIVTIRLDNLLE